MRKYEPPTVPAHVPPVNSSVPCSAVEARAPRKAGTVVVVSPALLCTPRLAADSGAVVEVVVVVDDAVDVVAPMTGGAAVVAGTLVAGSAPAAEAASALTGTSAADIAGTASTRASTRLRVNARVRTCPGDAIAR